MEAAVIIISLLFSAFFAGMEIAYVSANKVYLGVEQHQDSFSSKILSRLVQNPAQFVAAMLVGNTICLVVYSYHMGSVVLRWFGVPQLELHALTQILLQTLATTGILLITSEFLPKVFFQAYANRVIKILAVPAYVFYLLFFWVSKVLIVISDFILVKIFRTKAEKRSGLFSRADLNSYVGSEPFNPDEQEEADTEIRIFKNALAFSAVKAGQIMTPKTELAAVEVHDSVEELRQLFIATDFSKIVVYSGSPENILGYVHSFDLFKNPETIQSVTIPAEKVPATILIKELLDRLTLKGKSMAIVLAEDGKPAGIITVEDIIEELFGEIEDEHDNDETVVEQKLANGYLFSARLAVEELNQKYGLHLPQSDLYSTLGGLVVHFNGKIPGVAQQVNVPGYALVIEQASAKYIELVKIIPQSL